MCERDTMCLVLTTMTARRTGRRNVVNNADMCGFWPNRGWQVVAGTGIGFVCAEDSLGSPLGDSYQFQQCLASPADCTSL